MNCARRTPRARGFTLIEMLVVITIISILGALVLTALASARRTAKEQNCRGLILRISGAMDGYLNAYQDFPPSEGDSDGIKGAENLFECLSSEKKEGPYLPPGDFTTCDSNRNGKAEIADSWNRPIRYLHRRDYGNRSPQKGSYRLMSAGADGDFQAGAKGSDDIVNWNKDNPGN